MMGRCVKLTVVFIIFALFLGCAGSTKYMREVADSQISYMPAPDEAVVIFMRASGMAFAIQSTVFDVTSKENKLVGIVPAKKKVAYRIKPGKYLFMVMSEAADFLKADLAAGKTYYVAINPRVGAWKARFSLGAVHHDIDPAKLDNWKNGCTWVETTEATHKWARDNAHGIQKKRDAYFDKWNNKPESGKPSLRLVDGF